MANVKVLGQTKAYLVMSAGALDAEFEVFWQRFPNRIGKIAARKAYEKARGQATSGELLAGVERYIRHKPKWKEWCNPTTFLNQGRWADEYQASIPRPERNDSKRDAMAEGRAQREVEHAARERARFDAMPDTEKEQLRLEGRKELYKRFPMATFTPTDIDRWCVLNLPQSEKARA